MLKIRLTRLGRHKAPFYRVVAIDSRVRRDGRYIELLGTYDALAGKADLKSENIVKHLMNGAQPSPTVLNILKKNGIWKEFIAAKK